MVYLRRSKKVWGSLSLESLRRIVEHSESILRSDPGSSRDATNWFQAFRRLPEFSYVRALDVLGTCASQSNAIDAYYYLFILHFLLWRDKVELDEGNLKNNMDRMRSVPFARRDYSFEWLALSLLRAPSCITATYGIGNRLRALRIPNWHTPMVLSTPSAAQGQGRFVLAPKRWRSSFLGRSFTQQVTSTAKSTSTLGSAMMVFVHGTRMSGLHLNNPH